MRLLSALLLPAVQLRGHERHVLLDVVHARAERAGVLHQHLDRGPHLLQVVLPKRRRAARRNLLVVA